MGSITAANAVLMLTIPPLFLVPQQLQGFGPDDVFDIPQVQPVETVMGVDGILSGGYVAFPVKQTITLQADALSNRVFDTWATQMKAALDTYIAGGLVRLPSIATKYILTRGQLTGYKPAASAKRILQVRSYEITWESMTPSPA